MLRRSVLPVGTILVAFASVISAQPPRGQGRGGLGFVGPGGIAVPNVTLLAMPEVQKELAITEEQRTQVDELSAAMQDEMRLAFGNIFQEIQSLSDEERQKRLNDAQKKTDEAIQKANDRLGKILDAKQLDRLAQLRLQREGASAFGRPDVAKQLGFTDEQHEKLRAIQESSRPQFGGGFGPPDFARIEEQRQKAQADAFAVLTDRQKAKWAEMTGKEFKFPEPQFFGGPGGPGGFGPGGPGGPMGQERKIVKQFDMDGDGRLNQEERKSARESLKSDRGQGRGGRGFGPPGGGPPGGFGPPGGGPGFGPPGGPGGFGRGNAEPAKPGPHVSPTDVKSHPDAPLYEPNVLRTLFLEFEN